MECERQAVIILPSKGEMQKQIEELRSQLEHCEKSVNIYQSESQMFKGDLEREKERAVKQEKRNKDRINSLIDDVADYRNRHERAEQQAADYKREIDKLADTKTVLDNLMAVLKSPHNDYQKVVNELDDMLQQERSRANVLEQELRNIQFDIQRNQFLEGKVQAYEAMFRVNPIKAVQCESEQQETA